ncbi:PH domain-containing protein [Marinimicrobium agarilyticum]|uniref:PH domain-containing protein n=1 Tax=Marinimicrobium agarilyticum TaxID=306546 RepID=UPI00042757C7|nr:PH domain-containing protein [Marinimicrobium agarilyticum]
MSTPSESEWQRVSPVSAVYFFLKAIPNLVNLWPLLAGALAGGEKGRELLFIYGVPLVLVVLLLNAVVQYWVFRFKVEKDRIQIRSGLFHRKRLSLDFERVQQADIINPFYFRPLGLATLGFESAGSGQQEVNIPGIPVAVAEQLRQQVLDRKASATSQAQFQDSDSKGDDAPDYELRLPFKEVARYGLMHNALLFLAPLAAPLGQYMGPAMESWLAWLRALPWVETLTHSGWSAFLAAFLAGVVFIVVGIVLLFAVSMIVAMVYYGNYSLARHGERFQAHFGLGTQRTRGLRLPKMQRLQITQGMIARLLRRHSLLISKAGHFQQGNAQLSQRFVVPVLTTERLEALREQFALPKPAWKAIHPWYIVDYTLTFATLFALITGAILLSTGQHWSAAVGWALLWYPAFVLILWRRWSQTRYDIQNDWLAVRHGFIGRKEQWLPTGKLQKIAVHEPPILRKLGLSHLMVWTTDGPTTIGYLPISTARTLRDRLMGDVTEFQRAWF